MDNIRVLHTRLRHFLPFWYLKIQKVVWMFLRMDELHHGCVTVSGCDTVAAAMVPEEEVAKAGLPWVAH